MGMGARVARGLPAKASEGEFLRLPHVTIEYREEESVGVGKISVPLIIGLGLHWAWVFSAMFSAGELFSFRFGGMAQVMIVTSMAFMAATLMCYTLFMKQIRPYFRTQKDRRRIRFIAAVSVSVGLLCVALGALLGNYAVGIACCVVGGIASGVGSAALLMSYGASFSVCDTAASAMQFALSCIVTCVVYALVMVANAYAHPLGVALCVVIPLFELLCLNLSSAQLVDRTEFASTTMPVYVSRFTFRVAPSALAFGFLFGFLGVHAFRGVSELAVDASQFVWSVVAAGVITCGLIVCVMLTMRQRANYAFRTLNPVIALVIALITYLIASGVTTVVHCLFLVSYMLLEACLWISYTDMSQKFRISPFHVYGMGRGLVALGAVAATAMMLPGSPFFDSLTSVDAILPVALVLLVFGTSTYPRDPEIVDVLKRGTCCPAFFDPFDANNGSLNAMVEAEMEMAVRNFEAGNYDVHTIHRAGNITYTSVKLTPEEAAALERLQAPDGEEVPDDGRDDAAWDEAAVPVEQSEAIAEAVTEQQPAPQEQTSAASHSSEAAETVQNKKPEAPAQPAKTAEEQEEERIGRYKRRCLALANMCLLSRRETEVLFLLAKGYNTKMIQEQLFISAGTANTHMRHVYRKLDVHSQQDLIRMVDSMEVEDEDWS